MTDDNGTIAARRRQARPVRIPLSGESRVLEPVASKSYKEDWLKKAVHSHPNILPIWEIEPAWWPAFPACTELPLRSGLADNLLINPDGNIVLVECKLWRNPEARRKVIAQAIDYAKDLVAVDYPELEQKVLSRKEATGASLFEIAKSEMTESEFVDAVSRNLRRGRILLLVAGDGITEAAKSIAEYLQQHVGIHFTLAMVQLAVYEFSEGECLIVPSVPMSTENIVRGIVEIRDGNVSVVPPPATTKAETLTETQFLEHLDGIRPGTSTRLGGLVQRGQDIGLYSEAKKSLMVRLPLGADGSMILISVNRDGVADTSFIWWLRESVGAELLSDLQKAWIAAIPGAGIPKQGSELIRHGDGKLTLWHILDHGDAWLEAVRKFRQTLLEKERQAPSE